MIIENISANPRHPIVRFIDKHLASLIDDDNIFIAGGAARRIFENSCDFLDGEPKGDIDVFCPSRPIRREIDSRLASVKKDWHGTVQNNMTDYVTGSYKVSIIGGKHAFTSVVDLFNTFDYTVACFAYHRGVLYFTPEAARDARDRIIRYHDPKQATNRNAVNRMRKYMFGYGFRPCPGFLEAVANSLKESNGSVSIDTWY